MIATPVLRPPDGERTLEDRARLGRVRIGDDRRVEVRSLRAGEDRRRDDHPLRRVAVPEVRIVCLAGERVEAQCIVRDVEARLAAIAIDLLRPDDGRTVVLERPVVLRAALEKVQRPLRARRQALELQRRQTVVHVDELVRHPVQQALAQGSVGRVEAACVAFGRNVRKLAIRTDDATVRAGDELKWLVRNRDDCVLVGMDSFRTVWIAVLRQVAEGRAAIGRQ